MMVLIKAGTRLEGATGWDTLVLSEAVRCGVGGLIEFLGGRKRSRKTVTIDDRKFLLPPSAVALPRQRPIPVDVRALMLKGSVWEFKSPWKYIPIDTVARSTWIPQGKRIVLRSKCRYSSFNHAWGTCLNIRYDADFALVGDGPRDGGGEELPHEVWPHLTLIKSARPIERWRLVTDDGTPIVKKVFSSLNTVTASAAYRFGATAIRPKDDLPDITKGVFAEEYDPNDVAIRRIDLSQTLVMRKLKQA